MSRNRKTLKIKNKRPKLGFCAYSASEGEIQSDLRKISNVTKKRMKILKSPECQTEFKKQKVEGGNCEIAVDMLIKLQGLVPAKGMENEVKKIRKVEGEKNTFGHIGNIFQYGVEYQNYLNNMAYMQNIGFMPYLQYSPLSQVPMSQQYFSYGPLNHMI